MVDLAPGYHVVNVVTGETSPLPESITRFKGVANLEVSPDGSMLLFDNSGYRPGSSYPGLHQIYVANVNGSGVRQVTRDPVGASSGSWSPDGSFILFVGGVADLNGGSKGGHFSVLDFESGEATPLHTDPEGWFVEPRFASDGRSIVFTRWARGQDAPSLGGYWRYDLWTVPSEGGNPTMTLKGRGYADPSPDGRSILYPRIRDCANGTLAELWISDADRSDARVLAPATPDCLSAWAEAGWSPDGVWIGYSQAVRVARSWRRGVHVVNLLTGERTLVAFGASVDWLDHRTLIVRADPAT